ncbi:MAG: hypothetical protein ACI8QW_001581, partial [Saprospiraceae bacterium]
HLLRVVMQIRKKGLQRLVKNKAYKFL